MKTFVLRCALLMILALGTGCAVGQKIDLNHIPERVEKVEKPLTVTVSVQDQRPYVTSGNKETFFIGIFRAGLGNTWDVRTKDHVPFADIVKKDVEESLRQAGFTLLGTGAERKIDIAILEYNFDCYINCRVWHKFLVTVRDAQGTVLATSEVMDETTVAGSAMTGPKSAMDAQLPRIYGEIIARMIMKNKDILFAITAR